MRALLLPLALAACSPAAAGQDDNMVEAMNTIEETALAIEAAADAAANALEAEATANMTDDAMLSPAWMAGRSWLWAGQAENGATWYFDPLGSDFTMRPHRVLLRTDESFDPDSPYDNSERLAELDCAGHRYRILRTIHYDTAGRATEADERGDGRMVPAVAGSVLAQVEETVCRHAADPGGTMVMNGM